MAVGGCNLIATNKIIKTAFQKHFDLINNNPCACETWCWSNLTTKQEHQRQQQNRLINLYKQTFKYPTTFTKTTRTTINNIKKIVFIMCLIVSVLPNVTKAAPSNKFSSTKSETNSEATAAASSLSASEAYTLSLLELETNRNANEQPHDHRHHQAQLQQPHQLQQHNHQRSLMMATSSTKRLRKRHSKRHSTGYDDFIYNPNKTEWSNPCGGRYENSGSPSKRIKKRNPKKVYKTLKKAAESEFTNLNNSKQIINISAIQIWKIHHKTYKFLPKLKMNSSIALKRWYRNMQTYVGAFAFLGRVQSDWDHEKQEQSPVTAELRNLFRSARTMLCELETAYNNTHPYHKQKLIEIKRDQMDKRLKLRTKEDLKVKRNVEPNGVDLLFVKHYYYEFLQTMFNVLAQKTRRRGQINIGKPNKAFNESVKSFGSVPLSSSRHAANKRNRNSLKMGNNRRKRLSS